MPIRVEISTTGDEWSGFWLKRTELEGVLRKPDYNAFLNYVWDLVGEIPMPTADCPYVAENKEEGMANWLGLKFAFTETYISNNRKPLEAIKRLSDKYPKNIRIRTIPDELVVWEGLSGRQVAFSDEEEL